MRGLRYVEVHERGPAREKVSRGGAVERERAEAAERERDFTRDASHELRTPLTVIRVASDLIAHDDGLSPASRRSLARIQDAVAGMEAVIDALLFLARSEQAPLDVEDVVVREVVEREVDRVRPILRHKQLALHLEVEAEPVLHAPSRILQVMLGNLLSNTATANLIIPIGLALAVSIGQDVVTVGLLLAAASSMGIMLPVSTPPRTCLDGRETSPGWR